MVLNPGAPKTIGRYEILDEIGRGSMGIVYKGRDPDLGRAVAVKTLAIAAELAAQMQSEFEARFYQEARAAAGLQHPGIVVVYEVGSDPHLHIPYMALELLRGHTLEKLIGDGGRPPWKEALRAGAFLAAALQHAHSHGVVHRDLKPANVMILADGTPKIMDFGVARLEGSRLTAQGQTFGSPSYMAPEQALEARTDARSDIFSLGCVLYELVTGRRAFGGRGMTEILLRLQKEEPPAPSRVVPGLPPTVDAVMARAMQKDPARRYPTAAALGEDLDLILASMPPRHAGAAGPGPARRPVPPPATAPGTRPLLPVADAAHTRSAGDGDAALVLPAGKRISLAFLSGPRSGDVYVLRHAAVLIGRKGAGGGAQVELDDAQVSRAHAVLESHGMRFVLRDLQSTNGTIVGGRRILQQELEDQSEFEIGSSRMMLIVAEAN